MRDSLENPSVTLQKALGAGPTQAGPAVNERNAIRSMPVYAAVRVLSESLASLPLKVFTREGDRNRKREARDHNLWRLLHTQPNPEMNKYQWVETCMGHLATWGNTYNHLVRDNTNRILSIWPIQPNRVKVRRENDDIIYIVQVPGNPRDTESQVEERIIPSRNMLHIPALSFDGRVGKSPVRVARDALGLTKAVEKFGSNFFNNDARPGGVLEHPESLDEDAFKNIRKEWRQMHQGLDNSHRFAILEEGMTWNDVGLPPQDAQFLELRKFQNHEIARMYRIPPHMLAEMENATFSNIEEQSLAFVRDTLRPWMKRWEQAINTQLIPREDQDTYFAEFIAEGLLRGDAETRAEFFSSMIQNGVYSINDVRDKENMNPVEGGDRHWVPMNMQEASSGAPAGPIEEEAERNIDQSVENTPGQYRFGGVVRDANSRRDMMFRMREPIQSAIQTILDQQLEDIREIAQEELEERDTQGFIDRVNDYFDESSTEFVRNNIFGAFQITSEEVSRLASNEVGIEPPQGEVRSFTENYADSFARRHQARTRKKLIADADRSDPDTSPMSRVGERIDQWQEGRAESEANQESIKLGNAVSQTVFSTAGINSKRWTAFGSGCPYCDDLNGQTVGMGENFLDQGQDYQPEGAKSALNPGSSVGHPPAHSGCDCILIPQV